MIMTNAMNLSTGSRTIKIVTTTSIPTMMTLCQQENQLYNRIMGLTSKNFGQLQKVYNPPVNAYVSVTFVQLNNLIVDSCIDFRWIIELAIISITLLNGNTECPISDGDPRINVVVHKPHLKETSNSERNSAEYVCL